MQGDQTLSQDWKHQLEERQRNDQKLRKEGGADVDVGNGGKHWFDLCSEFVRVLVFGIARKIKKC
jgi:hypothetical protein